MRVRIVNFEGASVGEHELPSNLSGLTINEGLIWEVIKAENANLRQGTHKTKEKGEVRGGGAKPWRQKGTGRARQGSIRSPQWKGGGIVFGPRPRSYNEAIPGKKKAAGVKHILASKLQSSKVVILDEVKLTGVSTKAANQGLIKVVQNAPFYEAYAENRKLKAFSNDGRRTVTLVYDVESPEVKKSLRNIPWLQTLSADRLAARDLFYNAGLVITKSAMAKLEEKFKG